MAYALVRPITISAAYAVASITDIDFLFSGTFTVFKSLANGGFVQSALGYDIGFFEDAACTQPLDWEIERWNPTTGEIVAWMRLPAVVIATQTVVYAAIGDAAIVTDLSNPHGIWYNDGFGSGYRLVMHLPNTVDQLGDSTFYENTMTQTGTPTTVVDARIGAGLAFNGTSQYLENAGQTPLEVTGPVFLSMWFYPTAFPSTFAILLQRTPNFMNYAMGMDATGHLFGGANIRDFDAAFSTLPLTLNAWNFCEAGWYGIPFSVSNPNFVVLNGVRSNAATPYDSGGYHNTGNLIIAADQTPTPLLPGRMDEIRITTTPWTQPRSTMQYLNQSSQVFTFDGGIPGPAGCVVTL